MSDEASPGQSHRKSTGVCSFLTVVVGLLPFTFVLSAQQPTFRAGAVLVTVDVYPQQNGRTVEGLKPEDFEVLEDGRPQRVENFEFARVEPALADDARRDPGSGDEGNRLAADPRNRAFVLFLDPGHVTLTGSHNIRQPLVSTLRRILSATDLFGVMTPRMRPSDLVFGRSLTSIEDQLARYWFWGAKGGLVPLDPEERELYQQFEYDRCGKVRWVEDGAVRRPLSDVLVARLREDRALGSLERLVDHLGQGREARTAVLLLSSGWRLFEPDQRLAEEAWDTSACRQGDAAPRPPIPGVGRLGGQVALADRSANDKASWTQELLRLANLDSPRRFRDLIAAAQRRNVTFYPINPEGLEVFDESLAARTAANPRADPSASRLAQSLDRVRDRVSTLRTLAETTGGVAVVNSNDLAGGLRRIVDDTSAYYLLGYYSPTTRLDGAYHRIEVKLKRPGMSVKARRGYFAPSAAEEAARAARAAATATAAPVADALAVLSRLRSSAELHAYGFTRGRELTVVVEIPSAKTDGGRFLQGADLEAALTSGAGAPIQAKGRVEPASRGAALVIPLGTDTAGPWRVDLTVSAGADRLEDRVTIEEIPSGPLLGSPVVYRAAPGPRSPIRPVADFQFRRTERVHVEWPMLRALDQRQARLLGRNGQPLAVAADVTERSDAVPGVLAVDLNLAPLSAGDYLIAVTAASGGVMERRLLALRVVQ